MIPGDGVGPHIAESVLRIVEASGAPLDFEVYCLTEKFRDLNTLKDVIKSITKNKVCLKGILAAPLGILMKYVDAESLNMKMRVELDMYANVVHIKKIPGIETKYKEFDFYVIREYTEGYYSALEHESVKGVIESLKITTVTKSIRIAKFALDFAIKRNRRRVTAIHHASIMKLGDGTFAQCCCDVSKLKLRFFKCLLYSIKLY